MLGKTAGGLYWMARYLERSENMARMIEAGQRIALTRSYGEDEWESVLQSAGALDSYRQAHGREVMRDTAVDWLLRDLDNPSSIMSVISSARSNAKLVRTAITREVFESINAAWITLSETLARRVSERDLPAALSTVRQRAGLIRGAMHGTMLRNDIYNFARIGTFIERADNTARILDVKYYVLLPMASGVGTSLDNVQWQSILQSVSGLGGYRMTYGQSIRPANIAQFLIRDRRMPRSLAFCCNKIRENLTYLEEDYGAAQPSSDLAAHLWGLVSDREIRAILDQGLHEFLQETMGTVAALGSQIEKDYRFHV